MKQFRKSIEIKNMRFKAYVGGANVPFVALSMQATESGYTFSIAIPPIENSSAIKHGTYGYILYSYKKSGSYKLLCDGYLVSSMPYGNKGVYSIQLLFKDMYSALRFFYIDNSLLETGESDGDVSAELSLLKSLQKHGVDIIGKSAGKDNVLRELALVAYNKKKAKDAATFRESATASMNHISGLFSLLSETNASIVVKLIKLMKDLSVYDNGIKSLRKDYKIGDRIKSFTNSLEMTSYAAISTFQGLNKLSLDMIYGHGGIVDYTNMLSRVTNSTGLKSVVIPGMSSGQIIITPDTPYLPVLSFNRMGASFDSISMSVDNDLPITDAIAVFGLTQSAFVTEQPYYGVATSNENSYVHNLVHITKNPLEYMYEDKKEIESVANSKEKMRVALESIAGNELTKTAIEKSSIMISTNVPILNIVPGFGFKLGIPGSDSIIGRVQSFGLNVSTESISQSISLSHVFVGNTPLYTKKFGYDNFGNIGLYKETSVSSTMALIKKHVENSRYGRPYKAKGDGGMTKIKRSWNKTNGPYFSNPSRHKSAVGS